MKITFTVVYFLDNRDLRPQFKVIASTSKNKAIKQAKKLIPAKGVIYDVVPENE